MEEENGRKSFTYFEIQEEGQQNIDSETFMKLLAVIFKYAIAAEESYTLAAVEGFLKGLEAIGWVKVYEDIPIVLHEIEEPEDEKED